MSEDFVTRLQLQLRAAAEREERRGSVVRAVRATPWRPALALAAVVAAAIVVLSVAARLSHHDTTPVRPGPRIVSRTPLVTAGGDLLPAFGAVWAADAGAGQVLRLDPRTHAVRARIASGGNRIDAVAGSLWTVKDDRLLRIDPANNRVVARLRLPATRAFGAVVGSGGSAWVVSPDQMLEIDLRRNITGRAVSLARSGFEANGVATDGRTLYFSRTDGSMLVLDARTGAREASPGVPVDGSAFAADRGTVFLNTEKALSALAVRTGRTRWTQTLPVRRVNGATFGGGVLWVEGTERSSGRDRLWRLDAATGRVVSSLALKDFGVAGMAVLGGRLWMVTPTGTLEVIR